MNRNELFSPAASPESVGIPSSAMLRFLERIDREQICMHGFLVVRRGQVAAEGYWAPFSEQRMHRMYSISKSMVSLAIGLMIDEGKLRLTDRVANFFPDKAPKDLHPYLAQTTIRDLLMMADPHAQTTYTSHDPDWAAGYFEKTPTHPPGTIFTYNTSATVMLNTIVERIGGVPFLESMRKRLLDPIGFSKDAWCVQTPEGASWGGSGVICTLRDMAKLAYVCMNRGRWNGAQLISEQYIREATTKQIDNSLLGHHGYGYQIWVEKDNGFAFRGMGSQFAFCYPDRDFLFACIADTQGAGAWTPSVEDVFREELFAKLEDAPLPDDAAAHLALREKIDTLAVLPQRGELTSPVAADINGKWYRLNDNPMQITRMRWSFAGEEGVWEYENASGEHRLRFGMGKVVAETFPQTNYFGERIGTPAGRGYDCLSSAAWVEAHKLNMLVYLTDHYFGTLKMTFAFKGNEIAVDMKKAAEWFLDEYVGLAGGYLLLP